MENKRIEIDLEFAKQLRELLEELNCVEFEKELYLEIISQEEK